MLLVSQNLLRYGTKFPKDTVLRVNLAWVSSLNKLQSFLSEYNNDIFLDYPIGRTKPPSNKYELEEIKELIKKNERIKYFAVSNVESADDIKQAISLLSSLLLIVPKIESKAAVENLSDISSILEGQKIFMLDHDDLFSDLINNKIPPTEFFSYIEQVENFCNENSIKLLRTRGVIFSDEDEYNY